MGLAFKLHIATPTSVFGRSRYRCVHWDAPVMNEVIPSLRSGERRASATRSPEFTFVTRAAPRRRHPDFFAGTCATSKRRPLSHRRGHSAGRRSRNGPASRDLIGTTIWMNDRADHLATCQLAPNAATDAGSANGWHPVSAMTARRIGQRRGMAVKGQHPVRHRQDTWPALLPWSPLCARSTPRRRSAPPSATHNSPTRARGRVRRGRVERLSSALLGPGGRIPSQGGSTPDSSGWSHQVEGDAPTRLWR